MAVGQMRADPDAGIPDLVQRLGDDSKRLVGDEVRLAKLEMREGLDQARRSTLWLAAGLGLGILSIVAFTVFVATLIGRIAVGHMWIGAIVAAVVDLALGAVLLRRGIAELAEPSYSFEETRASLH